MGLFNFGRYDYQKILTKYSRALSQPTEDLNRFSRIAPYLLTKSLKLTGASVMVLDREAHDYVIRAGEKAAAALEGETVFEDSPLIIELLKRQKELSLAEAEKLGTPEIAAEMRRLKAVLVIPSISDSEYFQKTTLLATINLGAKASGEKFSAADVDFLTTLADQAIMSVEYAFIVDELKKNQARTLQAEKLAAIGTATAGIAHELKNPLTYISTLAQLLPQKWDDREFRDSVDRILPSEIQRMQMIVEGLLDYSRTRELSLKPTEIKEVLEKSLALLTYEIRKHNVNLKTDYQHSHLAQVDGNRLIQVFVNVLANAVQALGEKGGDLTIKTADDREKLKVTIVDNGPGIPADKLNHIFDPFFTTKESGTGLGLAITQKIVEEHHGTIEVDSIVGRGTVFTIRLPQAE